MATPPPNDALLCERCGYDMSPLGLAHRCPECGADLAADVAARIGSAGQRADEVPRLSDGLWLLSRPRRAFAVIKVDDSQAATIWRFNLLVASALFVTPPFLCILAFWIAAGFSTGDLVELNPQTIIVASLGSSCAAIAPYWVLRLLCWIEIRGVQFFGGHRGWRITPALARSVIAHSSVGWVIGGLLWAIGIACLYVFICVEGERGFRSTLGQAAALFPFVGLLMGLLIFESLVFIGIRACRFANAPEIVARYLPPAQNSTVPASPGLPAE